MRPQRGPYGEVTGPLTGQIHPLLPPWIGPAGSGVVEEAAEIWAWIWPWMSLMSPSSRSMSEWTSSNGSCLAIADRRELGLARLELNAGADQLGLARGDLVARRLDSLDRVA